MSSRLVDPPPPLAESGDWAVHRCEHGCFHLALGRLSITLSDEEFDTLRHLMWQAFVASRRSTGSTRPH